jgi:hypothetical protein
MICLCTGFCAFNEPRKWSLGDGTVYKADYFDKVFFPYHLSQVDFDATFVYQSKGDIFPVYENHSPETVTCSIPARELGHGFGWYSSVIMGAQYSLLNKCDMIYIEQDALVYKLKEALDWAKGKKIVYGFGDVSWSPGWAEHCFIWVSNEYLGTFLSILNGCRIQENDTVLPEISWHTLFKDVADFWPYLYGRKRPIDFDADVPMYAQQIRADEIKQFQDKLEILLK